MIGKTTVFVVLVLAASATSLATADARPRGGKHAPNAARPVGVQPPAAGAAVRPVSPSTNRAPTFQPLFPRKNAIGATPPAGIGPPPGPRTIPNATAAGGVKAGVVGPRPGVVGSMPLAPARVAKIGPAGPTTFVRSAAPTPAHGAAITGTGIARSGTTPGLIGGPAKLAGGITGTGMKSKR
jgi:hypothetical protein